MMEKSKIAYYLSSLGVILLVIGILLNHLAENKTLSDIFFIMSGIIEIIAIVLQSKKTTSKYSN